MRFEIKRLDIYRKVPQDLTEPTLSGAIISLLCVFLIIILVIVELKHFLATEIVSELLVESSDPSNDRILVFLNVSLIRLKCEVAGLDLQDSNGRHEVGFIENIVKVPINTDLGCRIEAQFYISKVPGNFHLSTHAAQKQPETIVMSHIVHELRMGNELGNELREMKISGGFETMKENDNSENTKLESHEYHLKIVPTIYEINPDDRKVYFYQYSYGYRHFASISFGRQIPAIWFRYDLTPITIKYKPREKHLYGFITMIFALIGGTFTICSIVHSIIFSSSMFFRKFELDKLN